MASRLKVKPLDIFVRLATPLAIIYCTGAILLFQTNANAQISLPRGGSKLQNDANAERLLQQMTDAYSHLISFQQRSVYTTVQLDMKPAKLAPLQKEAVKPATIGTMPDGATSKPVPPPPPPTNNDKANTLPPAIVKSNTDVNDDSPDRRIDRTVNLLFVHPNLLKITDSVTSAKEDADISKWISDGKVFSAYVPGSHNSQSPLYTQEKAPRNIHDFGKLQNLNGSSLELVMLMGVNPFQNVTPEIATLRVDQSAIVRGIPTEVVTVIAVSRQERTEFHLYIGKEDHLLHRFVSDITPMQNDGATSTGAIIGDSLDEMQSETTSNISKINTSDPTHPKDADDLSLDPRTEAKRIRTIYDNIITPVTHTEMEDFKFNPPSGAGLFTSVGSLAMPDPRSKSLLNMIKRSKNGKLKSVHDVKPVHEIVQ